jgi:hypothetical protein
MEKELFIDEGINVVCDKIYMAKTATECLPLTGTERCPSREHTAYHNKRGVLLYGAKRPSNFSCVTTGSV